MRTWTAPKGTKIVWKVESIGGTYHPSICPPDGVTVERFEALRSEYRAKFGLRDKPDDSFDKIAVTDPRFPEIMEFLEESSRNRLLWMQSCWLEEPRPKPGDPHAWFELQYGPGEFRKPSRTPANLIFSGRISQDVATRRFREVVERAGLTGLEWLPLEDSAPTDPTTWYEVYATDPIGRGLDHPLIDPATLTDSARNQDWFGNSTRGLSPARRFGYESAGARNIAADIAIEPAFVRDLMVQRPRYFRVQGPRRYVREHLPSTDFAYEHWGWKDDTGPGTGRTVRSIVCNAKARKVLIESGLFKPSGFAIRATVPASEANAEILDRTVPFPLPPPRFLPEEAAVERARREAILNSRVTPAPSRVFASTDEAVVELERRLRSPETAWTPAREDPEFEAVARSELYPLVPDSWKRIAPLLPMIVACEDENFDFAICPPEWNSWLIGVNEDAPDESPSKDDLVIAQTPFGDWFSIRAGDPLLPADAAVTLWDHETSTVSDSWPTVAAFASHVIEMWERSSRSSGEGG